ncbi:MAG: hypothetical protein MK291_12140 [Planctomycetes bacterium]|nr:hypothetical protein [Planctomycetota bacterium]
MSTTKTDIGNELRERLGLNQVEYQENLSKDELFHAAIANDRGRVREGGPDDEQKARPQRWEWMDRSCIRATRAARGGRCRTPSA